MTDAGLPPQRPCGTPFLMESRISEIDHERVRAETVLAPLLLQTEGLLVRQLGALLGVQITAQILKQELERGGLSRHVLIRADEFPLYLAVTFVRRLPQTRRLIQTMRREPTLPLGLALERHRLFGRKLPPSIRRSTILSDYQELFGTTDTAATTWERTYTIITPRGTRIAGVTEIFSPRLEERLRTLAPPATTG